MRNLIFSLLLLTLPAAGLRAQGGWGVSTGFSMGTVKATTFANRGYGRMFSYGPSIGIDIVKGVAFSLRYDMLNAHDKLALPNGAGMRHAHLEQKLGKFMIGYGVADPEGGMVAVQFGFTIGHEVAKFSREYPDGTISFGMDDPSSGVYESFRAMPPLVAITGGYALTEGLVAYIYLEKGFKKGFGESEFHDWHLQKEFLYAVGNGGSSPYTYLGNNDISSWRCEIGFKYIMGF